MGECLQRRFRRPVPVGVLVDCLLVLGAHTLELIAHRAPLRQTILGLLSGRAALCHRRLERLFALLIRALLLAQPVRLVEEGLEGLELRREHLDVLGLIRLVHLDGVERLRVVRRREDGVEAVLENLVLLQRPACILLVHEDDRVEHGRRDVHHLGHELVEVGALVAQAGLVALLVDRLQRRLEGLVLLLRRLLHERERARAHCRPARRRRELELDLCLDLTRVVDVRVVDEGLPVAAVGRQIARRGHLEALDRRRLPGAVLTDDQGERLVELDDLRLGGREGADAADGHLVDRRHGSEARSPLPLSVLGRTVGGGRASTRASQ